MEKSNLGLVSLVGSLLLIPLSLRIFSRTVPPPVWWMGSILILSATVASGVMSLRSKELPAKRRMAVLGLIIAVLVVLLAVVIVLILRSIFSLHY
jgi:hypothetical protein